VSSQQRVLQSFSAASQSSRHCRMDRTSVQKRQKKTSDRICFESTGTFQKRLGCEFKQVQTLRVDWFGVGIACPVALITRLNCRFGYIVGILAHSALPHVAAHTKACLFLHFDNVCAFRKHFRKRLGFFVGHFM